MSKSIRVVSTVAILAGVTAVAIGQAGKPIGQPGGPLGRPGEAPGSTIMYPTPALRARMLAVGRLDKEAAAALDVGDYATAEDAAGRSVSLGVESGLGEELLARALFEQGKDDEALRVYRTIAERGANATRNEFPYALLLLKAGRWPQAVAAYNTALTLGGDTDLLRQSTRFSPGVPQPRELEAAICIGLGVTSLGVDISEDQRRNSLALAHLQGALVLEPGSPLANYYYARGLQRVGHRTEAQAAFRKAAELGQGDVKAAAEQALK